MKVYVLIKEDSFDHSSEFIGVYASRASAMIGAAKHYGDPEGPGITWEANTTNSSPYGWIQDNDWTSYLVREEKVKS